MNRQVAFHLGQLARDFSWRRLCEYDQQNYDEMRAVIHLYVNNLFSYRAQKDIKYADVVNGGDGMKFLVASSGGPNVRMQPSFMIFINEKRSYLIQSVEGSIFEIRNQKSCKSWMDHHFLAIGLLIKYNQTSAIRSNRTSLCWQLWCTQNHSWGQSCSQKVKIRILSFLACSAGLVQPVDSFVIQAIKLDWKRRWNKEFIRRVELKMWADAREKSGCVLNHGENFFSRQVPLPWSIFVTEETRMVFYLLESHLFVVDLG